ncbi:tumor necrosis factor receptor superfamily member 5-like isoform X2 [Narcine bancroftii]|uniref:tumor necrosis factor receptor superfamily member 5-like isoform X2 n=1 Tax=Narcine bancroftii TaxID=1343680 RepID=UPI0038315B75
MLSKTYVARLISSLSIASQKTICVSMEAKEGKMVIVTANALLLTALVVAELNFIGSQLELHFSDLRNHDLNRRWHGLDSIKERSGYQQIFHVLIGAKDLKSLQYALPLIFLIIASITYQARWEELLSISGPRNEAVKKIFLILLLVYQFPTVAACHTGEYVHNNLCCSMCPQGSIVSKHCTLLTGTNCNPCKTGEYVEQPNGLEKCFKCKACDKELGLQIKHRCISTSNTVCGPREGYYCIENCQMAQKHKTCPPGQGVKTKGTPLKDTVCINCSNGTFSNVHSSTEECKKWTICENLNLVQMNPGSREADVECVKNNSPIILGIILGVIILLVVIAGFLWRKYKGLIYKSKCCRAKNDTCDVDASENLR